VDELLLPKGPLFQLQYNFLAWLKPVGGPLRNVEIFAQHLKAVLVHGNWSVDEVILNYI
jgi:hypothetical protein